MYILHAKGVGKLYFSGVPKGAVGHQTDDYVAVMGYVCAHERQVFGTVGLDQMGVGVGVAFFILTHLLGRRILGIDGSLGEERVILGLRLDMHYIYLLI